MEQGGPSIRVCTAPSISDPSICFPAKTVEAESTTHYIEQNCRLLKWACTSPAVIWHFEGLCRQSLLPLSTSGFSSLRHSFFLLSLLTRCKQLTAVCKIYIFLLKCFSCSAVGVCICFILVSLLKSVPFPLPLAIIPLFPAVGMQFLHPHNLHWQLHSKAQQAAGSWASQTGGKSRLARVLGGARLLVGAETLRHREADTVWCGGGRCRVRE